MQNNKYINNIVAGTAPTIKRSHAGEQSTSSVSNIGAPRIILRDIMNMSYVVSSDQQLFYKNSDKFNKIKQCKIQLSDILDFSVNNTYCSVSACGSKNCKTCKILITDTQFTSNLTSKKYNTHSHDDLNCKSSNVVYGIECNLCGLIYVGETKGRLNTRMNGHRFEINNGGNQLLYQHFNQPDHSVLSMKVRLLEKIYHPTNNPTLSTPYRLQREDYWIKELCTASPYGCNDKVVGVGNLSSPNCSHLNTLQLFNKNKRDRRSHGHRRYNKPNIHDVSFSKLLPFYQKPLGLHHIRTKLYSIPLSRLKILRDECLSHTYMDPNTIEYKLDAIILDIAHNRLFKPVQVNTTGSDLKRHFLKLQFSNKGIDAINIANILNHKYVNSKIPPYFEYKEPPLISYSYSKSIASKIFNYKQTLQSIDIKNFNPPPCSCSTSLFNYSPVGHVITGDLNIISNSNLRCLISKGPKYREAQPFTWGQNFKILMDSVEEYARTWAKREKVEVDTLSEWIKSIRSIIKSRIAKLRGSMDTKPKSVLHDPDVLANLSDLHDKYVVVPADKASNNIVFVCKTYYYNCLIKELGFNSTAGNPTYTHTDFTKEEILSNHNGALNSFGVHLKKDEFDLPSLYWIPKLHKNPYKERFIAGSSKCTTKPLSVLLTKVLTVIKDFLQTYSEKVYSTSGVNQMWILKNSKELLEHLGSQSLSHVNSIKTYDFSTLYTTIPHTKLKTRLKDLIKQCFFYKNGNRRYKYLVLGKDLGYFVKEHTKSDIKYTEDDITKMLEFLIDNIFVVFGNQVFQQTVGIPMGTNCAPLLADLFLFSYEADFIQRLFSSNEKTVAKSFNFTYRYIDDVLSLNNPKFSDYLDAIYPSELEIKDTTESSNSASYLDLQLEYDSQKRLCLKLYDKRDDFNFPIVNFPFLSSNIPASPAYGVYVSQLIRYARASSDYGSFVYRGKLLTNKLLTQGYCKPRLIRTIKKFYGRHHDIVNKFGVSISKLVLDIYDTS